MAPTPVGIQAALGNSVNDRGRAASAPIAVGTYGTVPKLTWAFIHISAAARCREQSVSDAVNPCRCQYRRTSEWAIQYIAAEVSRILGVPSCILASS